MSNINRIILKYTLKVTDVQEIEIPVESQLLSIKAQNNNIVVYYKVNVKREETIKDMKTHKVKFYVIGTGNSFIETDDNLVFINTVALHNDSLMFHVFIDKYSI